MERLVDVGGQKKKINHKIQLSTNCQFHHCMCVHGMKVPPDCFLGAK